MNEGIIARGRGRPFKDNRELPLPFKLGKRWVWRRPDIENFRRVLEDRPTKAVKTSPGDQVVTSSPGANQSCA